MNRHKLISRTRAKAPHAAFTLIELLIVVAIIAILAAIAVPNFLEAQTRAKVSRAKADMRAMATAAETYHIDYNKYMISDGKNPYYPTSSPHEYDAWGTSSPKDYEAIRQKYSQKYDALFRLTSPISYMSSMPAENPFGEYDAYNVGDKHVGYSYRGTPVMARLSATIYPPEWADTDPAYSISATGPSKKLRDSQGRILVYDPTNGTTSFGGIWYVYGSTSMHSFH